ncbi:diguanylate cyclase [Arenimonas sp.]|uniref:diguanylate cyclase n=1 Tax=Arenimonas sp. TaxID=1872635 RepID=UPI002E357A8E|nr:diguanylate cyclase [Arenimonas sp.]HEX4852972.1 diguanylate cyclase [Arenimonas sp.]
MRYLPAFLIASLLALWLSAAPARAAAPAPALDLAVMETPVGTTLDDILTGRAQPGFTPVLTPGFSFQARPDRDLWVRIRTELPEAGGTDWRLAIVRAPLDRIQLKLLPDARVVAEESFFHAAGDDNPWPANFLLPLPAELAGKSEFYLQLQGKVNGGLHLRLQDAATARASEAQARRFFRFTYGVLLLVAVLSLVRHVEDNRSGAPAVGGAALGIWLACLGINGHLYSLPELSLLADRGATVPQALLLLCAGPMVLATRYYSGLGKAAPGLVPWARGLGWGLVLLALWGMLGGVLTPLATQWLAWVGNGVALTACLVMLLMDSRSYRWAPLLTLLGAAVAVLLRVLADAQVLAPTLFNLYGWQPMLAATVALYLALPWIRARLQRWAIRKRAEAPEPTAAEKIQLARERLVESLQAGLKSAADGDLKWIAFRRLLDGLKPVLSQTSAAVVAMHFHGEDLMQVEPPSAEGRYRELLAQRTTLLKNLSRLRAPQQLGIDFDGPVGPLGQVQLAVIPLPIPKPGWGALLIERQADVTYSDAELALCAEFAAVAIMAGEEAAGAVKAQKSAETDPATGVLRVEALRQRLDKHMETARLKQTSLSLLCIQLDQAAALREGSGEVGATAGLRPVAELLLEEIEYGDVIGRSGPDGFLVLAPGRKLLQARDYAERLRAAISRLRIDPRIAPSLSVSVGVAQAGPDERDPAGILERAARAAQIANKNGGNQIFN